jgi:hypothetical protein
MTLCRHRYLKQQTWHNSLLRQTNLSVYKFQLNKYSRATVVPSTSHPTTYFREIHLNGILQLHIGLPSKVSRGAVGALQSKVPASNLDRCLFRLPDSLPKSMVQGQLIVISMVKIFSTVQLGDSTPTSQKLSHSVQWSPTPLRSVFMLLSALHLRVSFDFCWVVTPCERGGKIHRFGGTYCLYLQCRRFHKESQPIRSTSSLHRRENLKSR